MKNSVWKFELPIADNIKIQLPEGAKQLHVAAMSNQSLNLWALVDVDAPFVDRKFSLRGTGHPADGLENVPFIGTVIMMGGAFVCHLWDGAPDVE